MATTPNFAATPRTSSVVVNTANTNVDGTTGTRADVYTAGSNGSRVDAVQIKGIVPEGSTQAADTVRLWINNGTNSYLWKEALIASGTGNVSTTVANAEVTVPAGIDLPAGSKIQASTHTGGSLASYHVTGFGGDY